jgi:hypothetical protein
VFLLFTFNRDFGLLPSSALLPFRAAARTSTSTSMCTCNRRFDHAQTSDRCSLRSFCSRVWIPQLIQLTIDLLSNLNLNFIESFGCTHEPPWPTLKCWGVHLARALPDPRTSGCGVPGPTHMHVPTRACVVAIASNSHARVRERLSVNSIGAQPLARRCRCSVTDALIRMGRDRSRKECDSLRDSAQCFLLQRP